MPVMPGIGTILTAVLQAVGIIDWLKQVLHDHTIKVAQQATDIATEKAATVQEVDRINAIRAEVQNLTHDQLIAQYAKLQSTINANAGRNFGGYF